LRTIEQMSDRTHARTRRSLPARRAGDLDEGGLERADASPQSVEPVRSKGSFAAIPGAVTPPRLVLFEARRLSLAVEEVRVHVPAAFLRISRREGDDWLQGAASPPLPAELQPTLRSG
jgi:hypothetical protein